MSKRRGWVRGGKEAARAGGGRPSRGGTGRDRMGLGGSGASPPSPSSPCVLSRPQVRRAERKSQARAWRARGKARSPPPPPPRGSSASLVQWFLTVQQFSIIIVKCLGPLDQRGPGIGPAAADESGGSEGPGAAGPPGARSPLTEPGDGGVLLEAGCCT